MKIVVCGFGYVGATVAACLIRAGTEVVGVDPDPAKLDKIRRGESPVSEPGVGDLLASGKANGLLKAAATPDEHVTDADMVFVCVGTPSNEDGSLDLDHVVQVTRELGQALRKRPADRAPLMIVFRSTMLPGTMDEVVAPLLAEEAGEEPGRLYELAYNPEFLRESTAIADFLAPPKVVVGERVPGASRNLLGIYDGLDAPRFNVSFKLAEMVKYVDNSFHAVKVAFANEVGRVAATAGVDPQEMAEIFISDTKLNVSPYYLWPGGPFGGSCLPKDVRALNAYAREKDLSVPLLASVLPTNLAHKEYLAGEVRRMVRPGGRILLMGLTFKDNTDDLRESPLVDLAETLLKDGFDLRIWDPDLNPAQLLGQNAAFARTHLARLPDLLVKAPDEEARAAELVVLGKAFRGLAGQIPPDVPTLDAHRLRKRMPCLPKLPQAKPEQRDEQKEKVPHTL